MPEQIVASHLSGAHIGKVIRFVLTDKTQIEQVITGKLIALATTHALVTVTLGTGTAAEYRREYQIPVTNEVRIDASYIDFKDAAGLRPTGRVW